MTGLLVLPAKTDGSVGRAKNTLPEDVGVEVDLDYYETAAEAERQKDALIAMAARMGLGDGTTPGSFEAMKASLEAGEGLRLLTLDGAGEYASIRIEDSPTAPSAAHGYSAGYRVGAWWVQRVPGELPGVPGPITLWQCIVDTDDAAVWQIAASPSDDLPLAGAVSAGTAARFARADHVHPQASSCVEEIAIADGVTLAVGNAVALVSGRATLSDARSGSTVPGYIGQCVVGGTGDAAGTVMARVAVSGVAPASGLTAGLSVYLSTATAGAVSTTAPAGLGALWHRIGHAISSTEIALQIDVPTTVDWCSPLDIPTNGIFYGRANSGNSVAGGRLVSVPCLFGSGRVGVVDGSGSAPAYLVGGGPGSDAWFFVRTSRQDRIRIAHDAGMTGVEWSGLAVVMPRSPSFSSVIAKTAGSTPRPFDFGQSQDVLPYLAGEASGYAAPGWRIDAFSRSTVSLPSVVWSRGSVAGEVVSTGYTAGTDDICVGNRQGLDNGFDGRIAAVAVWNRALTADEHRGLARWARREWML